MGKKKSACSGRNDGFGVTLWGVEVAEAGKEPAGMPALQVVVRFEEETGAG